MLFAVTGVSAEWVGKDFTSLRVTVQEEGLYRISYSAVNKSNATKPMIITTSSKAQVLKHFRPDCFYIVMVEAVSLDSNETENGSIGIGEQELHYYTYLLICLYASLVCVQFSIL